MAGQKQPSGKQKKFARLVAAGSNKTAAYNSVYPANGGSPQARKRTAYALASKPAIRELIEHYEAQLVPLGDLRTEQENALSNLKYLAYDSPDHKVRMAASVKLFELLEIFRERQHKYKQIEQPAVPLDEVVSELLQIAESQPAIELETVESDTSSDPAELEIGPAGESV
jgi:hypothetical protein